MAMALSRSFVRSLCLLAALAAVCAGPFVIDAGAEVRPAPKGPVILTIAGDIGHSNRGPVDPKLDGFFKFHEIEFERAFQFDRDTLARLPRRQFTARLPEGHETATFSGPLLSAVLEQAGVTGGVSISARALDGYVSELSAADLADGEWVLVLARNGVPLGLGGFGPALLLKQPKSVDVGSDAQWPWAVFYIEVSR